MSMILVVDDMAVFREPIAATLRVQGFQTVSARDGVEALTAIGRRRPDLILLDIAMPGMDGLSFLRALRGDPQYKQIPVILLTAVAERDYVVQAAEYGVQDYLLKSHFKLEDMLLRVRRCLGMADGPAAAPAASSPALQAAAPSRVSVAAGARPSPPPAPVKAGPVAAASSVATADPHPALVLQRNHRDQLEVLNNLKPVVTRDELRRLVTEGLALRPLAPVVQSVMAATANARCSADEVAKAVGQDQALSIRVLKLANSSVYSRGTPVDNLRMAVGRLGSREIRNLVMALGVLQHYEGRMSEYLDARLFWEHSVACGLIAAAAARACNLQGVDDCFLWGMVHDVGRLVLIEHLPDKYAQVWETARESDLPLELVEARMMTLDHCDTLKEALHHWEFPSDFIVPVVNHHQTASGLKRLGPNYDKRAAVSAFADRLSKALLAGSSGNDVLYSFDSHAELLGLSAPAVEELAHRILGEADDVKLTLLMRMSQSDWPSTVSTFKKRLAGPFQPLCVGPEPNVNAVRMFFSRLSDRATDDQPNCGILYLPETSAQHSLLSRFESQERECGAAGLPLLLVVDKGQVDASDDLLSQRRYAVVKLPARFDILLDTVAGLLRLA